MPVNEQHREKRKKNLVMLLILLGIVGMFFALTILKFTGQSA